MTSFFSFLIKKKFPGADERERLFKGPVTLWRAVFYALFAALLISSYLLLLRLHDTLLVSVPARGGTLTEGIIGAPRFLTPVLAAPETGTMTRS